MKRFAPIVLFLSMLVVGCGDDSLAVRNDGGKKGAPANSAESASVSSNAQTSADKAVESNKDLIVAIGGNEFREAEFKRQMALRFEIESIGGALPDIKRKTLETRLEQQAPYKFVNGQLLASYAESKRISVTAAEVDRRCLEIAKGYKCKDAGELLSKLSPVSQALFKDMVREEVLKAKAKSHILSAVSNKVSDEELSRQYARLGRINANGIATNRLVYAKATNVWNRLMAQKLTFEEAVDDYTEDQSKGRDGYWGRFKDDDLREAPELLDKLSVAKDGAILPPIECDNALCIVKLSSRTVEDDDTIYMLSRILFKLAEVFEVPTKKELTQMILEERRSSAIEAALTPILKKNPVRYGAQWTRFGRKKTVSKQKPRLKKQ